MKFKITITKEVIDKSLMCGTKEGTGCIASNCAFAVAYNDLVPAIIGYPNIGFQQRSGDGYIAQIELTLDQKYFINQFDLMDYCPQQRYTLVGQTFDVEIPDEVIEYWYGDTSKAAQKIIDNPIMQLA